MPIYSNSSGSRVRSIDYEVAVELLAFGQLRDIKLRKAEGGGDSDVKSSKQNLEYE